MSYILHKTDKFTGPPPKFKYGERVILLDFRNEDHGTYNYFWIKKYNDKIGKIITVKESFWDTYMKNTWVYRIKGFPDRHGFNEHWLKSAEFQLEEDLFEL